MKRKKSVKQKITEVAYEKQSLQKKMIHLQKCIKEVDNVLNGKKQ
ncbi:hypothetical protein [Roseburia sp. 499]|nr:hypothetical protein [Roseburia sp. 499]WVK69745.1 hypothetical protein BIV20_15580 [Roseburia sp. 499]